MVGVLGERGFYNILTGNLVLLSGNISITFMHLIGQRDSILILGFKTMQFYYMPVISLNTNSPIKNLKVQYIQNESKV